MKTQKILLFLFNLLFTATCLSQSENIQVFNTDSIAVSPRYSHAVIYKKEGLIKTSGIVGNNKSGQIVGKDNPPLQITQAFENIQKILQAAGTTPENVVEIDTHLTDTAFIQTYREVRQKFFSKLSVQPVSTTVVTKALVIPGAIAEISVVAKLPDTNDNHIYVFATLTAKPQKANELEIELLKNAVNARREPGCMLYEVHRGNENKNVFILYEKWRSKTDLNKHFEMPYMKDWISRRDTYLEKREMNVAERLEK